MKKMISILLVLTLLFSGSVTALAAQEGRPRPADVDHSRLITPEPNNSYPVTLKIENMTFNGTLSRGGGITDENREDAIDSVLKEMNLSRKDIQDAHNTIARIEAGKSWSEILGEMSKTVLKMLGVEGLYEIGAAAITDISFSGSSAEREAIAEGLRNKRVAAVGNQTLSTGREVALLVAEEMAHMDGKMILGNLISTARAAVGKAITSVNVITAVYDAMRADQKQAAERVASYAMRNLLKDFYSEVNSRLRSLDKKGDWAISVTDVDGGNFTFLGVPECYQTYNISMELVNKGSSRNADPNGVYEGKVKVVIEHEMSPFDRMILHYVRNPEAGLEYAMRQSIEDPYNKVANGLLCLFSGIFGDCQVDFMIEPNIYESFSDLQILEPKPKTEITRTLTSEEFTIELMGFSKDKRFNFFRPDFSGFESETLITSTHSYEVVPRPWTREMVSDVRASLPASLGIDGPNGDVHTERDYSDSYCDDEYILYLYSNNPRYSQNDTSGMPLGGSLYPAAEIWDMGIWKKWEKGDKVFMVDLRGSGR